MEPGWRGRRFADRDTPLMTAPRVFDEALSHCDTADVLDALGVGVAMLDSQLCLTYANPLALERLCIAPALARGRPMTAFFSNAAAVSDALRSAMHSGRRGSVRAVLLARSAGDPARSSEMTLDIRPIEGFSTGPHLLLQVGVGEGILTLEQVDER